MSRRDRAAPAIAWFETSTIQVTSDSHRRSSCRGYLFPGWCCFSRSPTSPTRRIPVRYSEGSPTRPGGVARRDSDPLESRLDRTARRGDERDGKLRVLGAADRRVRGQVRAVGLRPARARRASAAERIQRAGQRRAPGRHPAGKRGRDRRESDRRHPQHDPGDALQRRGTAGDSLGP